MAAPSTKILETEFRNGLYKSLLEAGYDKQEAQKIVGVKYMSELKKSVCETLSRTIEDINADKFDNVVNLDELKAQFTEMKKMHSILNPADKG